MIKYKHVSLRSLKLCFLLKPSHKGRDLAVGHLGAYMSMRKVKEESEKPGLKLSIQKTKIVVSSPITSWQIGGETLETWQTLSFSSVQFNSSVVLDSLRPMYHRTQGLPVHHQLTEFTQTHVHQVRDAIQPSHPRSSPSPPAPSPSQHQGLFQ